MRQIKNVKNIIWWLLLSCVCCTIMFAMWQNSQYSLWQYDSEGLVMGRVYQMQTGQNETNKGGFMGAFSLEESENKNEASAYDQRSYFFDDTPVTSKDYWPYLHQSGLQGTFWGIVNRVLCMFKLSAQARLMCMHVLSMWLFCAFVLALAYWVLKEWGIVSGVFSAVAVFISPWALRSGANLYWRMWLFVALFVISAFVCKQIEHSKKIKLIYPVAIFVATCICFLCGFEYTSWVLINLEIPVVYYWVKNMALSNDKQERKIALKKWFKVAVMVALSGIAAFCTAMAIWFTQLYLYFGSAQEAIGKMLVPIATRTGALSQQSQSITVSFIDILKMYFTQDALLLFANVITILIIYIVVVLIAVAISKSKNDTHAIKMHIAQFVSVILSAISVMSWLILASGHSAAHPHINYVLWIIAFLPLCAGHISVCVGQIFRAKKL